MPEKKERVYSQRKVEYKKRLERCLEQYKNILVIHVDNVGSKQLQEVRLMLRGRGEVLMGKNTVIRRTLREQVETKGKWQNLLDIISGNIGFVFTDESPKKIREEITANKVPAAARVGLVAPSDVKIPAGPTGLDPGQTGFFQALNIATKIVRGSIEIINEVHLIREGEKVSASAVSLLSKLNIKPFFFGIQVLYVSESGNVYSSKVLDMTDDDLLRKFFNGVSKLTSVSLAIGYPTLSTIPHSFARAFKYALSLAVVSDFSFPLADKYKEFLADPAAYAAKHGIVSAPAEKKTEETPAAAPEPEEEEESEEEADFDLFD